MKKLVILIVRYWRPFFWMLMLAGMIAVPVILDGVMDGVISAKAGLLLVPAISFATVMCAKVSGAIYRG